MEMNSTHRHTISLCMGSSCYVNGSVPFLQLIQQFLREHDLEQIIELKGSLCQGNCKNGPSIMIDKEPFTRIDSTILLKILSEKFLAPAGKRV